MASRCAIWARRTAARTCDGKKRVKLAPLRSGQLIEYSARSRSAIADPVEPPIEARRPGFWLALAICVLALAGLAWVLLG